MSLANLSLGHHFEAFTYFTFGIIEHVNNINISVTWTVHTVAVIYQSGMPIVTKQMPRDKRFSCFRFRAL